MFKSTITTSRVLPKKPQRVSCVDDIFDELFSDFFGDSLNKNYPPYDLIKTSEAEYVLRFALAGWRREDITVARDKNYLYVSSRFAESSQSTDQEKKKELIDKEVYDLPHYYKRGISMRSFSYKFKLQDAHQIRDIIFDNGILTINLELVDVDSDYQELAIGQREKK